MKKVHFLGCLLLIITIAACEKKNEIEVDIPVTSGQFTFKEKTYNLHYCSIRRSEWFFQIYEALLYSHDKSVCLELSFINNENGIPSGNYQNFGFMVNTIEQQISARLSLCHIRKGEELSGEVFVVEFGKNVNAGYDLCIYPKESPDEKLVYWSGKLSPWEKSYHIYKY